MYGAFNITKLFLFIALFFVNNFDYAQNLVPNPSYEDTISCPVTLADLTKVYNWGTPTDGSPDYFNSCNLGIAGVPSNVFGTQYAVSGNAYIGISLYDLFNTNSYREYIQVQLTQTLTVGQKYWVSFYVSLADTVDYGIKEIGAYFSDMFVYNPIDTTLSLVPQIQNNGSVITNKNSWTKINGSFVATGIENYMLIGNFNRKQTTTAQQVSNTNMDYSYYYIDQICVSNDSLYCNQTVGMNGSKAEDKFNIFPNPVNDYLQINQKNKKKYDLVIYNALGQILHEEKNITSKNKTVDTNSFNNGILFLIIKSDNEIINYKFLKL